MHSAGLSILARLRLGFRNPSPPCPASPSRPRRLSGLGAFVATALATLTGLTGIVAAPARAQSPATLSWTGTGGAAWDFSTLNWSGPNGATAFKDGDTVRFDNTATLRTLTLNAPVAPAAITFDDTASWTLSGVGAITGPASLLKAGSGSLTLGLANTHTGGTRLNDGTLVLTHVNGLGAGLVTLAGGTLDIGALTLPAANTLVIDGSARVRGGSASGAQGIQGVRGDGVLTLEATNLFDLEGGMANYKGRVLFTGTHAFRFFGSNGSQQATFDLGTRTASVRSGTSIYLGALEGATSAVLTGASGGSTSAVTYIVGENNRDTVFPGTITNGNAATALYKYGTGRLLLSGISTYTGVTGVGAGRFIVTGALGSSPVLVLNNATFGGRTGGSLTLYAGARLALGVSPDGTRGPIVGGGVSIEGLVTVVPEDLGGTLEPGTYDLITYAGAPSGAPQWAWQAPADSPLVATFDASAVGVVRITLSDPRTAFARWADGIFGATTPDEIAGPLADPDADGLPNLLEYALGGDPVAADGPATTPTLALATETGALTLAFARVADPALTYEVEAADSLASPDWTVIWSSTGAANTSGPVVVEDVVATATRPARFLRLKVH
jgi:autotransporter-associated beta strand protein